MKSISRILTGAMLMIGIFWSLSGCKDSFYEEHTYTANVPVYLSWDDLRKSTLPQSPTTIGEQGKIYIKDNFLFVNEKYKGIHIFDNSSPASPMDIGFINIPGNVDLAIKGNYLYADSYVDLVVFDISNINNPHEIYRLKDIFPYTIPETSEPFPITQIDTAKGVIVGWKVERITERVENGNYIPNRYLYYDKGMNAFYSSESGAGGNSGQLIGVGGSLARFIVYSNQMYALNYSNLQVVNLSDGALPVAGKKIDLTRIVETLFIDSNNLFIGTQTGMLIYSLADANNPVFVSQYDHFQSCDPVVVSDGYAYITMRAGNRCGSSNNQMDVVDLRLITMPALVKSYPLTEPYGLGIDTKTLFVCDGAAGLKIYDATDPLRIDEHLIKTFSDINATDVIPAGTSLILLAADGIYQYDYSDLQNIYLLSRIPLSKKK
jgi:hypothetical protein